MIAKDEDSLICDFAETYHILEYESLPVSKAALLASGLRDGSRIMKQMAGSKVDTRDLLIAAAVDRLSIIVWQQSEDGQNNRNRPISIAESMMGKGKGKAYMEFESGSEFEAAKARIIREAEQNG